MTHQFLAEGAPFLTVAATVIATMLGGGIVAVTVIATSAVRDG